MINRFANATCLALVFSLAGAVATPATPGGHRLEKEEKSSVSAQSHSTINIRNPRGRTVIVGRADATSVSVVAKRVAVGRDDKDAGEMLGRLSVDISERGDEITVETRDENHRSDGGWSLLSVMKGGRRSSWIDYTVEVPHRFNVSSTTTSGEIRVSNIGGKAEIAATSGDVNIHGITGATTVHLTSGDLEVIDVGADLAVAATSGNVVIDNVKGHLKVDGTSGDFRASRVGRGADVQLVSGDLVLDGCTGDVSFRTSSGDARLAEIDGAVDASSSSGDMDVSVLPVGARVFRLSSSSGDIDLFYLPARQYGFALDVRTSSGTIECDLPIKVSRVDRRRLQGIVGSGQARIQVETASGDVSIVESSEAASTPQR